MKYILPFHVFSLATLMLAGCNTGGTPNPPKEDLFRYIRVPGKFDYVLLLPELSSAQDTLQSARNHCAHLPTCHVAGWRDASKVAMATVDRERSNPPNFGYDLLGGKEGYYFDCSYFPDIKPPKCKWVS